MLLAEEREALAAAGRRLTAAGLVTGTSGNLSARRDDLVAVTPTGAALGELTADMMTVIDGSGTVVEGTLAPTSEVPMHLAIYAASSAAASSAGTSSAGAAGIEAIAHTHATCSTAIACTRDVIPLVHYVMLGLGGEIRVAPYATFGTAELAGHVVTALDGRQAALMRNHGSIATGASVGKATENLELVEWCAELYARCLTLGEPRLLTSEDVVAFGRQVRATGYGSAKPL
jgi:L-fuculose-phosphate aldolase